MQLIAEKIGHDIYIDIFVDFKDVHKLRDGEYVEAECVCDKEKVYGLLAVRGFNTKAEENIKKTKRKRVYAVEKGEI